MVRGIMRKISAVFAGVLLVSGCIQDYRDEYGTQQVIPTPDIRAEDDFVGPPEVTQELPAQEDGVVCKPQCDERVCGPNGCGGKCGLCEGNQECTDEGACTCPDKQQCFGQCCKKGKVCNYALGECCVPDCEGKECGPDGCGHECGGCAGNLECNDAQTGCVCFNALCNGVCCDDDDVCHKKQCCVPDCYGKVCGDNGCGGTCGSCEEPDSFCLDAKCEKGQCVSVKNTKACDDEDVCTLDDKCGNGVCQGMPKCADGNLCTLDECDAATGDCTFGPDADMAGQPCEDNNPCTSESTCTDGLCKGELSPPSQGGIEQCLCYLDEDCAPLDDDNVCNGTLFCKKVLQDQPTGVCDVEPETILDGTCDDDNPCTDDSCDPQGGCINTPNGDC